MGNSQSRHELEGVNRREQKGGVFWPILTLVLAVLLVWALFFKPGKEELTIVPEEPERFYAAERPAEEEPVPAPVVADPVVPLVTRVTKEADLQKLSKDIDLKIDFQAEEGGVASVERKKRGSYQANYTLNLILPKAAQTREEVSQANSKLMEILPGLEGMLESAKISPWYDQLYENKVTRMRKNLSRLDSLLTRHNFYDCQTMLNLTHAESGQRVFLLQAEMDVVSDGSDGDRLAEMPDEIVNSTHYQPFTSYSWPKLTDVPNPMVAGWRKRIGNADEELTAAGTTEARKQWLRERKNYLQRGIEDMERRSFLVADYDPFIVIPVNVITDREDAFAPNVGDYAAVIYGEKIYPAIVGDGGPTFKIGEASLRLAKEINSRASPYSRPVSDLTVTYVVFPRTGETPWRVPDYGFWKSRCSELLDSIGGLGEGYELHEWTDLFPKEESVEGRDRSPSGPADGGPE